jgi:hypothetical protein
MLMDLFYSLASSDVFHKKGEDNMNAAGMTFVLTGVSGVLGMKFFQNLVTDGSISEDELDGTRKNLSTVIATLKKH